MRSPTARCLAPGGVNISQFFVASFHRAVTRRCIYLHPTHQQTCRPSIWVWDIRPFVLTEWRFTMFTKQVSKPFHAAIGTGLLASIFLVGTAGAEDSYDGHAFVRAS